VRRRRRGAGGAKLRRPRRPSFGSRSRGNAFDGSSWEAFTCSNRGTIRSNFNAHRWHYVTNPNPFPGNDGPQVYSHPAQNPSLPLPTARLLKGGTGFEIFGFGVGQYRSGVLSAGPDWADRSHTAARVPHWFVALLLLGPSLYALSRARRMRHRHAGGLCRHCGYDLRVTTSGRCPECGEQVSAAKPAVRHPLPPASLPSSLPPSPPLRPS